MVEWEEGLEFWTWRWGVEERDVWRRECGGGGILVVGGGGCCCYRERLVPCECSVGDSNDYHNNGLYYYFSFTRCNHLVF